MKMDKSHYMDCESQILEDGLSLFTHGVCHPIRLGSAFYPPHYRKTSGRPRCEKTSSPPPRSRTPASITSRGT